jgi:hypothetical protein
LSEGTFINTSNKAFKIQPTNNKIELQLDEGK